MPRSTPYAAYLFVSFAGEAAEDGERIRFAVSDGDDPRSWVDLNRGEPVLASDLGEGGLRDPFIIRAPEADGDDAGTRARFFLIATDLKVYPDVDFARAQQTGSRSIMVWESTDLVTWSPQRAVEVAPANAGNAWAPEATWDDAAGEYVVYWASALYPDELDPAERDIRTSYQRMFTATTRDFREFSPARLWIDEPQGPGLGMIDSAVAFHDGAWHRFTKDESVMGMRQETSPDLRRTQGVEPGDGWTLLAERIGFGQPNPWGGEFSAGEGPSVFRSNAGDRWYLLQDQPEYHGGHGYALFETADLTAPDWRLVPDAVLPASPRHGTVIPITEAERQALLAAYPPA
ncbi:glycoside hydrolase family 43 protein [Agromyces sp. MMS24-K17]|uniref:glycoside hydrolase family 43 protein n=1 Tax=Agromyces sp. MMS24-K17 TaxID=3372850 RepID=UPI003754E95C